MSCIERLVQGESSISVDYIIFILNHCKLFITLILTTLLLVTMVSPILSVRRGAHRGRLPAGWPTLPSVWGDGVGASCTMGPTVPHAFLLLLVFPPHAGSLRADADLAVKGEGLFLGKRSGSVSAVSAPAACPVK